MQAADPEIMSTPAGGQTQIQGETDGSWRCDDCVAGVFKDAGGDHRVTEQRRIEATIADAGDGIGTCGAEAGRGDVAAGMDEFCVRLPAEKSEEEGDDWVFHE